MIPQTEYLKVLRPLLPAVAFRPNGNKIFILAINLVILGMGWSIARTLDRWPIEWLWLYLPLAAIVGNSGIICLFGSHETMHGSTIEQPRWRYAISFLPLAIAWMPPTLWKVIHNHRHHSETNAIGDPDRSYLGLAELVTGVVLKLEILAKGWFCGKDFRSLARIWRSSARVLSLSISKPCT